jgi:hypothetical protein
LILKTENSKSNISISLTEQLPEPEVAGLEQHVLLAGRFTFLLERGKAMAIKSALQLYEMPIQATFDDVDDALLEVFFALGIVNPFGPTLSYVAAIGQPQVGVPRTLVTATLNPFHQEIRQVGKFVIGDDFHIGILDPLYRLTTGACPSLVLLSANWNEEIRLRRSLVILSTFDPTEVDRECFLIESYFGNPWDRISAVMKGQLPPGRRQTKVPSPIRLASINAKPEHLWPEIRALVYAWDGSINQTSIAENIKQRALSIERFKRHFEEKIFPSLWLPKLPAEHSVPPAVTSPARYEPQSISQLRTDLYKNSWDEFTLDQLADLLRSAIILYGLEVNGEDIPHISRLYQVALVRGVDAETRLLVEAQVFEAYEKQPMSNVAFIPFLVCDPDKNVASKAVIDFISESGYANGELTAILELRTLFQGSWLSNRAAVFGGIAALGDAEVQPFLKELKPLLSPEEVNQAAHVHTQFLKHRTIQFWLQWCKELINANDEHSQKKFGSCASALSLCLRYDHQNIVVDGKRNFPCTGQVEPITKLARWTLDQYADLIAPDLYDLEARESAPKLFSQVLRDWGLKPAAALMDQFIPEEVPEREKPATLRDRSPGSF